jgi:dGTPase
MVAGLNLTAATLDALLKYPWLHRENPSKMNKWGSYQTERRVFEWVRSDSKSQIRSIEAEIMDWADDITYAIHDMVDFYCAGLIPMHLLASQNGGDLSRREWGRFFDAVCSRPENANIRRERPRFESALRDALGLAGLDGPYSGSQQQNSIVWRFSSELISKYVRAIKLIDPSTSKDGRCAEISAAAGDQATILKQLTWHYVIRRSDLATLQHGQQSIIEYLFEVYEKAIRTEKWELFPVGFAQLVQGGTTTSPGRWAADYLSGLTEKQVSYLYLRLKGRS